MTSPTSIEDRANLLAPTIASLQPSWTRSLRAAGKSPNTVSGYSDGLRCFNEFLTEGNLPQAVSLISREHVEMFMERELQEHKPSTAATRFRSLRLFWRWCVDEGEIVASPMVRMRPPAVPEVPIPVIPVHDLTRLLRACEGSALTARRDFAIVRLAVDTGLRRAELAGILAQRFDKVRVVAVDDEDTSVGYGETYHESSRFEPRRYFFDLGVNPDPLRACSVAALVTAFRAA